MIVRSDVFIRCRGLRWRALLLGAAAMAYGIVGVTSVRAADLDVAPYDGGRYQPYPSRSSAYPVYPVPREAPPRYGYRPYAPGYPQAWADPDDAYGDGPDRYEAYRYGRRDGYYRRPYAVMPPAPMAPRGPYVVDPRYVPPDDMLADEGPPPYGWRGQPAPRW